MQTYVELAAGVLCPVLAIFLLSTVLRNRRLARSLRLKSVDLAFYQTIASAAEKRLATIEWAYSDLRERALVRNAKGQITRASDEKQ